MKYLSDPGSISSDDVLHNLMGASCVDRTKLFSLIFAVAAVLLLQPILICINIDRSRDEMVLLGLSSGGWYWPWVACLSPLWIIDSGSIIVLVLVISHLRARKLEEKANDNIGKIQKPVGGTLGGAYRMASLYILAVKVLLVILTQILLALRVDYTIQYSYVFVFFPLYAYEIMQLLEAIWAVRSTQRDIRMMITVEELESTVLRDGRSYADLSEEEKDELNVRHRIVHVPLPARNLQSDSNDHERCAASQVCDSSDFQEAQRVMALAFRKIGVVIFHSVFLVLIVYHLDHQKTTAQSWWITFLPLWIFAALELCSTVCRWMWELLLVAMLLFLSGRSLNPEPSDEAVNNHEKPLSDDFSSSHRDIPQSNSVTDLVQQAKWGIGGTGRKLADDEISYTSTIDSHDVPRGKTGDDIECRHDKVEVSFDVNVSNENESQDGASYDNSSNEGLETGSSETLWRFGSVILCTIMTCVFVGILEGGDYSAIWVIFPLLLVVSFCDNE